MKKFKVRNIGLLAMLAGLAAVQAETFSIAILPDTQNEIGQTPDNGVFAGRMEWIVKNKTPLNLKFVLSGGDVVNWDTPDHFMYKRARAGADLLTNAGIPFAFCLGNHDTKAVCGINDFGVSPGSACPGGDTKALVRNTLLFNEYLPTTRFKNLVATYEPNKIDNAYHTFSAAGLNFLVINLELWPRQGPIDWAKIVVRDHPNHNVIVVTHMNIEGDGTTGQDNGGYGATSPQHLFDDLLSKYPNVRMAVNGHTGTHAFKAIEGLNKHLIYQFNTTYHATTTNPTRILEINTDAKTIKSSVFVPSIDKFADDGSTFTISNVEWTPAGATSTSFSVAKPVLSTDIQTAGAMRGIRQGVSLRYTLAKSAGVSLDIYDAKHSHVANLVNESRESGSHETYWNGTTARGEKAARGVYFAVLQVGSQKFSDKLMLQ